MKNQFSTFSKLIAAAVCALSLGSCSRAEYAMLPKGASYHGVARVATPVPASAPAVAVAPATVPTAEAAPAPAVASTKAVVLAAPAAKSATIAAAPVSAATAQPAVAATAPAPKMSFVQRMAVSKLVHKMDKLAQKSGAMRSHENTASTARGGISGNLRTGLILLLVGLLVGVLGGVLGIFYTIGTIIAIIGLVFIVLWLLDQA